MHLIVKVNSDLSVSNPRTRLLDLPALPNSKDVAGLNISLKERKKVDFAEQSKVCHLKHFLVCPVEY